MSASVCTSIEHDPQKEGWMVAELCAQCAQTKQHGAGEGCCDSLQCAFLRGYDIIDSIIDTLTDWRLCHLEGDHRGYRRTTLPSDSEVTAHLLPLYSEVEKAATGLLWQMSGMIRSVSVCSVCFFAVFRTRSATLCPGPSSTILLSINLFISFV